MRIPLIWLALRLEKSANASIVGSSPLISTPSIKSVNTALNPKRWRMSQDVE
ncbi:MAG TPA: hypothetical protein V6D25_03730 [Leptolyngbyaceae cyanobacterium]